MIGDPTEQVSPSPHYRMEGGPETQWFWVLYTTARTLWNLHEIYIYVSYTSHIDVHTNKMSQCEIIELLLN
jgi:hypothetical protein